jgi:dTDP-4-dehydrorhamnose reductase
VRILVTGAAGQLGQALVAALQPQHTLLPLTHADADLSQFASAIRIVEAEPDVVIHAAAMTNVDGCARDPDRALLANGLGTRHVALACQKLGVPMLYISTNEVFDGRATQPYLEYDSPRPQNSYGYSKWVGEQAVQQLLSKFYIVRIAWVFGGERNFVRTIQRLARERTELAVVDDEIGNPTFASDIAQAVSKLIAVPAYGVYHFVNEGYCSRYEFAREILQQSGQHNTSIRPIKLADYQRDSTPPPFAALRNFVGAHVLDIRLRPWQDALADFLRSSANA